MFRKNLEALSYKYDSFVKKYAGTGHSKAYVKAKFAEEHRAELEVLQYAKVCRDISKEKGWNLPGEYPPLAESIRNSNYSGCVHNMQVAMFRHEDAGELTLKERLRYMRRADRSWVWIIEQYLDKKGVAV